MINIGKKLLGLIGIGKVFDSFSEKIGTKLEELKIKVQKQLVKIISLLIFAMMAVGFILAILFFANLTLAFFLNDLLDSSYLGFLIVTGFYVLLFILFFALRKRLINKNIHKVIFKNDKD